MFSKNPGTFNTSIKANVPAYFALANTFFKNGDKGSLIAAYKIFKVLDACGRDKAVNGFLGETINKLIDLGETDIVSADEKAAYAQAKEIRAKL